MQLSEVFVTLHTYYRRPFHSSPISGFYFTLLRFYSIFASPFYYCYNILHGFYPLFLLFYYVSFYILFHPLGYLSPYFSVSSFQVSATLPFYLFTSTTGLFSSSNHITSSYLCYFQIFFPYHHTGYNN